MPTPDVRSHVAFSCPVSDDQGQEISSPLANTPVHLLHLFSFFYVASEENGAKRMKGDHSLERNLTENWREVVVTFPNFPGSKRHSKEVGESEILFALW